MEMAQQRQGEDATEGTATSRGMPDPKTSSSPSNPLESYGADMKGSGVGIAPPPRFLPQLFTKHPTHARQHRSWRWTSGILPLVKETDNEQNDLRVVNESRRGEAETIRELGGSSRSGGDERNDF